MILCGIDLETSDLGVGKAKILEIACALYDTEAKKIFSEWSHLVWDPYYPEPNPSAIKVNGLDLKLVKSRGVLPHLIFQVLNGMHNFDAFIAHNGINFDKPILEYEANHYQCKIPQKPWIDSQLDIPYPEGMRSLRLGHLAVDHGLPVFELHRALSDVRLMLGIISNYDIEYVYARAHSPVIRVDSVDLHFSKKHLAKTRRYQWDPDRKLWFKKIRECDLQKEVDECGFDVIKSKHIGS